MKQYISQLPLLSIQHLTINLPTARGTVYAVRDVSFSLAQGETLALVGESGCGKSVTAQAIMGLLPERTVITAKQATFDGQSLLNADNRRALCGQKIAMIFQNPMATFNPTLTIGYQITEPLRVHRAFTRHEAEIETARLLERMHITDALRRMQQYPHEFSGGMLQRAAIAMALAANPALLIADEPTTALDVNTQHSILELLSELRDEKKLALLLISHDLRIVNKHAQRVAVMYAGEIVETAHTQYLLETPQHPYTQALLAALPQPHIAGTLRQRLRDIAGAPPDLRFPPEGCSFTARCSQALPQCAQEHPLSYTAHQQALCHLYNDEHKA